MDPLERLLAERACERLVIDFVRRLDLGEPSSVAELFTEDGWWEWPPPGDGRRAEGRAALAAYFGSRPAGRLSRRVMSNILVTVTGPRTATATSYFQTYRVDRHDGGRDEGRDGTRDGGPGGGSGGGMLPAGPPVQVGHYEDRFRCLDGRWLLASRSLVLPFGGPTPTAGG
ncbi:nuclear transport factor 2 family protein [Streptomyces shenzhenensis]|uniref:nuclear transport factor 2 family protein n=1 Tax=Streptomyces shenzhenensis TaxID=943815 RepID=UPI0015F03A47|nr:nuclear transport factor 2 family protein [Streptomyces shenzhenensis]